jgi:hypothetical protein
MCLTEKAVPLNEIFEAACVRICTDEDKLQLAILKLSDDGKAINNRTCEL